MAILPTKRPAWSKPFIQEPEHERYTGSKERFTILFRPVAIAILSAGGLALQLCLLLTDVQRIWIILPAVAWALNTVYILLVRPRRFHLIPLAVLCGLTASQCILLIKSWQNTFDLQMGLATGTVVTSVLGVLITIDMPMRDPSWSRFNISKPFSEPSSNYRSPEDNLSFRQWMTASWVSPILGLARERQLDEKDVWQLPYEFQHEFLHHAFRQLKGSVLRRLLVANWVDLAILSVLEMVELVTKYSEPILLQGLLQAMQHLEIEKRPALMYAILILLARVVNAQSEVFSLWYGRRCYERSRGEMITMLYEKTLNRKVVSKPKEDKEDAAQDAVLERINTTQSTDESTPLIGTKPKESANLLRRTLTQLKMLWGNFVVGWKGSDTKQQEPADMGKIMNLMRYDSYEVAQRFWDFQQIIEKPIGLILSLVLMWRLMGWSAAAGVGIVVFSQVMNYLLALVNVRLEKFRRRATDKRLQQTSQYIESIRHLRWYGWQNHWLKNVLKARQKELNIRVVSYIWFMLIFINNIFNQGMIATATFAAYTILAKKQLSVAIIFPAIQIFDMVQNSMGDIPELIQSLLNAHVAMKRIQKFMEEPDKHDPANGSNGDSSSGDFAAEDKVKLQDASFAWPGLPQNVLDDINITFGPGLNVIAGEVASGKSALLQAVLGELDMRSGKLFKPLRPIAYCSQTPWLQSMTIRDNILFNSVFEPDRYKTAIRSCALLPDLASFEKGDLSPIGENGIGLSGGQKARVALARAVYSHANILLLDDPLSALDQQTSEFIVSECFQGELLKGRTVVLVTHRTDLCETIADQFVTINSGRAKVVDRTSSSGADSARLKSDPANGHDSNHGLADAKYFEDAIPTKFEEEEHRAHGDIKPSVYWRYVKAGSITWWGVLVAAMAVTRCVTISISWYLKEFGESYQTSDTHVYWTTTAEYVMSSTTSSQPAFLRRFFDQMPDPRDNVRPWLVGLLLFYTANTVAFISLLATSQVTRYLAGKNMFEAAMHRVSKALFRFYDVTPTGRLMNRLTSDIGQLDSAIGWDVFHIFWNSLTWVASLIVVASITPLSLAVCVVLAGTYIFVFSRFLRASQGLRRLEAVSLSPLMTNFGTLLAGLATVRAFRAENRFQSKLIKVVDTFQGMDHFYWSVQCWLTYRLEILSAFSTLLLTMIAIYGDVSAGLTAFMLLNAQRFVAVTSGLCKTYGKLQVNFVSVERVIELLDLDQEPSNPVPPPAWWPSYSGSIVFDNVTIRYAPDLEPALVDVSFELKGGTNTAVVGRTGSGKSTLAAALLATVPIEKGRILIDGLDLATIDRQALRSRVTFLAQEPVLFEGTLQHNLDPTKEHTDSECEAVIKRCANRFEWALTTPIETGGKNLSQGQRQLVGLARAILRRSSVIIMDEATASIDVDTAWEIQRVLREELQRSTVITIAHRTAAVRDANNAIVLAGGRLQSFGPANQAASHTPDDDSE